MLVVVIVLIVEKILTNTFYEQHYLFSIAIVASKRIAS